MNYLIKRSDGLKLYGKLKIILKTNEFKFCIRTEKNEQNWLLTNDERMNYIKHLDLCV